MRSSTICVLVHRELHTTLTNQHILVFQRHHMLEANDFHRSSAFVIAVALDAHKVGHQRMFAYSCC